MKFYIVTDLEGPAGVNLWAQTREGPTPANHAAKQLLTAETNAAVDGILEAAPGSEIVVNDGHGSGGLIFEELHPAVKSLMHAVNEERANTFADAASYDAILFVGQHAMAGTPNAPLCHTFSSRSIEYYKLNGQLVGEIGCIAARFGELGVPVIFLAGDDKACAEARMHIPEIVTVATKEGLGIQRALHLSAITARQHIREGAARAVQKMKEIKPYHIDPPYVLEIRVLEGINIDNWAKRGDYEVVDSRTVRRRAASINGLFAL